MKHTLEGLTPYERKALEPMPSGTLENKMMDAQWEAIRPELNSYAEGMKHMEGKMGRRLDDMQRRLDKAELEQRRPIIADPNAPLVKASLPREWDDYLRKGHTHGLEEKALSAGSNPDGGWLVPQVMEGGIRSSARDRSNIRTIADVQTITGGSLDVFIDPDDISSAWVGEMSARPETTAPNLKRITIPVHEIYAMPKATQTLLDDSAVNIEEWVSSRVRDRFDRQENAAFVNGDGVAKPRGFLQETKVADASWAWGKIGYIATGQATFDAASPADDLIDLVYSLKTEYRANATWVMNSTTAGIVRKMKDAEERYIWQQSLTLGQPSFLLGYPVVMAEDMPDLGDGNFPIAFGDFRRGYTIVDRIGIRVLRDPFSNKPFVVFYTTKRVGGGVVDFDAIKLLKTAAN